ncbi:MAG: imidazole glycerol phosphate synthase subunit HisH [Proteobacteria bacterium]|nr:imidazole glycerol phosphate synthase subunit HisH [Pseudomonadota bacterium]
MITIVDYNAGNIRSVQRACSEIGAESVITQDPGVVVESERIIFPGVGAATSAMETLQRTGLDTALKTAFEKGIPILGICLGAQIVLDRSEESDRKCLGIIPGSTVRFNLKDTSLKVPHIGWNGVTVARNHPLLEGVRNGDEFYFVHSYYPHPADEKFVFGLSEYEIGFCCALGDKNLFATQFHPEKSGRFGLQMLERFSGWDGSVDT